MGFAMAQTADLVNQIAGSPEMNLRVELVRALAYQTGQTLPAIIDPK